jgi:hypothetical protein
MDKYLCARIKPDLHSDLPLRAGAKAQVKFGKSVPMGV